MIANYTRTILFCCPVCGKLTHFDIHIFQFSGNQPVILECGCKKSFLAVQKVKKGGYAFYAPCLACNEVHSYEIGKKTFWNEPLVCFACPYTEFETFYAGTRMETEHAAPAYAKQLAAMTKNAGSGAYFLENPVAADIAERLLLLKRRGKLTCACGSKDVRLQVYYDRVELICACCSAEKVLDAIAESDAKRAAGLKSLVIAQYEGTNRRP